MSQRQALLDKKALLLKKLRERKAAGGEGTGNAPGTTSPAPPKQGQDRIPAIGRSGPLAVSFGQERLWLLDQLQPSDAAFNMPLPLRLRGRLDRDALRRAVAELVRRHESLRTTFAVEGSLPVQRIHPPGFVAPVEVDLRDLDPDARRREAEALIEADAAEPFDLARGPLYRATLVRLQDDEHLLLQNMHHVISDGWSTGVLFKELRTLLGAFTEGRPSPLPEPELHYADFAAWQRKRLSGEVLDRQVAFWRRQLEGAATSLGLPTDRPRPSVATSRGDHIEARLVADAVGPLRDLARGAKGTLYMVLLTAFKILLHRMSGQGDISVGTPVAGRERLETQDLVGFFLNTLTLRSQIEGRDTFRDLLGRVRSTVLEAKAHQEVPFEKLLQELQPERHLSQAPFFQVMFNMANIPDLRFELPGLEIEHLSWGEVGSKFDLTLYVLEDGDGSLALNLAYNVDLFDRARMVEMLRQYQALLSQIAAAPDSPVGGFDLLTDAARRTLPNPAAPLPAGWNGTVADGVARHAADDPARLAVTDPVAAVTYGELLTRSRRIARRLLGLGIETGDVVAVWAHRSAPLAESMLGILQAGAAFTMLDPQYPEGRLLDYLSLANPKALLRMERAGDLPPGVLDALAAAGTTTLDLPAEGAVSGPWADASDGGPSDRESQVAIGPDDLAYVAFTSGSTGKPKAILGRHGSLTAFLPWLQETFHFDRRDRHSLLSALSHDPLHRDVFMPLWYGAALAIPDPERIGEPGYAATWARDQGVTILNLVPAMLQLLTSTAGDVRLPALRHAFTVGDVLTRADVDALYGVAPNAVAVNLFGSTETQRAVSHVILPREPQLDPRSELGTGGLGKAALPLGRGLDGVQLLVLGDAGRQAGVGEVGEVHVRSHHLALGYTDAELTRERFLPNPFTDTPGDRLYRTGDLGRYLPDGGVEYLGRADFQVKIRGFRIELQEIETALGRHPAVADCAVVVRGDAGEDRFLAAYLVAVDGGEIPSHRALRAHLSKQLPDYMVPATFTVLDALPLTRTGKLDRRALPEPEAPSSDGARRPPSSPEEQTLAAIWESLLGRENLGLDDGFFELGGHSLLATQVLARLRDAFEVELPLRVFFEHPTLGELAAALAQARRDDRGVAPPPLVPVPRDRALPLSFSQQRLWFLDRLEPESPAYVLSGAVRIRGPLDTGALERAFGALVERHEALRTRIVEDAGRGLQRIDPPRSQSLPVEDLSHLQLEPRLELARQRATAEARRPFRLDRDPLLRTGLLRLAGNDHVLLVSIHHIVSDGWSLGILFRELGAFYAAENGGAEVNLPTLPIQFADYAAWERTWLDGPVLERQLAFWTEHLAGAPPLLELPTDRPRPAAQTFSGARHPVRIDAAVAQGLEGLGRDLGATPFMALLGSWALVLGRHAGQDDVVVGTPIAHRGRTELEGVLGFFANTLPLRTRLAGDGGEVPTFADLLARVRRSVLDAFAHQDLPFEKLVTELDAPRDLAYSPVFQTLFALQNLDGGPAELAEGLAFESLDVDYARAQFDLSLVLMPDAADNGEGGLFGWIEYNTDLFDPGTIERLATRYGLLLEQAVANPRRPLPDFDLTTEAEGRLLETWNATAAAAVDLETPIHLRVTRLADEHPDRPAVAFEGSPALTYRQLVDDAARLANHLRTVLDTLDPPSGSAEATVGLALDRRPELVVAELAILMAGAAYVPLDPHYPEERLTYMLGDAGARLLVTGAEAPAGLRAAAEVVVDIDADAETLRRRPSTPPAVTVDPRALAYVIYTSGSTGRPKGVQIPHRAFVNFLDAMARAPGFKAEDRLLSVTTPSFDIAGLEIFLPLACGGLVDIAARETAGDGRRLAERLSTSGATVMQATPATWRMLLDAVDRDGGAEDWGGGEGLRALCGGEALPRDLARRLGARVGELWNVYGPTETTVWSTARRIETPSDAETDGSDADPAAGGAGETVGRPIANTEVHVVDPGGRALPVGVAGELVIGGVGVARGYRDRPALTAERFIPDPFSGRPGARLYRTGDLARWRGTAPDDGDLEILGRLDHQVKVRGFRIELGEIEAALEQLEGVEQAAAVVRTDLPGGPTLAAFVTPADAPDATGLKAGLRRTLPEHMVPSHVVHLDALPLTANLKVDRRALLARPLELAAAAEAVAPRDGRERTLAQIYAQLLGRDAVGVHDDFFDLGGHSLLATQVVARIRSAFGVEPPLRVLFENPTVALLAEVLADLGASEGAGRGDDGSDVVVLEGIPTADRSRPLPTSFAQERLWLLDQIETESTAYNLSGALDLRGRLDADALGAAFADLATRHGSLRTTFAEHPEHGGHGVQIVGDGVPTVESVDLRHLQPGDAEAEADRLASQLARTPFDLGRGPLLRLTLARLGDDHHRLIYALHHIVSDGWSMGILIREVSALYAARVSGRDADLPPLPVQYADYAAWERGRLTGETLERQLGYWRDHLAGAPALLELPTDRPRPPVQTFRGGAVDLELSPQLTARLRRLGQGLGDGGNATLFMVLMAAWQALLARLSGQDDIVVGTPIAHRTRAELEGLIGFFANTLVMRTRPDDGTDFLALLAKVRRAALDSYAHQDLPFEKLVAELEVPRNLARSPVFQVLFTLQNAPASGFDLPGLRVEAVEVDRGRAQFDLSLVMVEDDADGGLFGRLEYNADLFDEATAARWLGYYARLLEAVASAPTAPLHRHSLVDDAERGALLETWNDTARELPRDSLHGWIARVADRRPEAVAVAPAPGSAGDALTYGELRSGARRLARHLRSSLRGAGEPIAEAPVGVLLERGPHMVTALLGILEAGAAYLPLDPAYPADRLRYMLESSGATTLVTEGDLAERLGLADVARGIRLDAESAAIAAFDDGPLTEVDVDPSRLAYVLYTSGSTGLPKGVQIPHGALVNFLRSMARAPGLGADDTLLAVTTLSFDIAGLELFLPLSQGGKVLVADRDTAADGLKLKSALEASDATAMQATPATWRMLLEAGWKGRPDLRVLCGGEALPAELARRLNAVGADLWNVYGPTEATVWSTIRPVPAGAESRFGEGSVTLGAPIDNTQTHVVDRRGHLAPTGVPGELLIGGTGLARGYRGRPALTAERFVPDPFSGRPGARLYRTGDLIRRRVSADGGADLEFLGRLDHQVKVRGFRIELGEIEAALDAHPAVRQGVVTVRHDGPSTRLVAYVVPSADGVDPADLAVHLRTTLPDYMVPAAWVQLDAMPLTPNGKVDRKALPAPEASSTADAEPPEGDAEIGLADIWGEVLGRDGVGRRDNFFALGGDSVLAIQVVTRARGAGWTLEVREIFQHQTLAELAAVARVREPDRDASGQAQTSAAPVRDDGIDILGADLSDDDLDDLLGDIDL